MTHRARADLGIVRPSDVPPTPWANGVGVTRVLAARPAWRISLAEIEGRMPFSPFPGADRVLIPLGVEGLTLAVGDDERFVPQHAGAVFRGEDLVFVDTGRGSGSAVTFMTRRESGRMQWRVRSVDGGIAEEGVDVAVVLRGDVMVGTEALPPGTVIGRELLADVESRAGGLVVLIHLLAHRMASPISLPFP